MKNIELKEVGAFTVGSKGQLMVSDPCYDDATWCQGKLKNVKPGEWIAYVVRTDEGRNAALIIIHGSKVGDYINTVRNNPLSSALFNSKALFDVGVDSGQAGFFDAEHFNDNDVFHESVVPKHNYGSTWFGFCCEVTVDTKYRAGVIPYGAVSSSGYGDGGYDCEYHRTKDGTITMARIVFIEEDEIEELW